MKKCYEGEPYCLSMSDGTTSGESPEDFGKRVARESVEKNWPILEAAFKDAIERKMLNRNHWRRVYAGHLLAEQWIDGESSIRSIVDKAENLLDEMERREREGR